MQQPKLIKLDTEEEKQEVMRRIERSASFQRLLNCPEGELFLAELEKQLRPFHPDPYVNAFNGGIRWWWDFIQKAMNQDVETARKILEEHKQKEDK